MWPVEAVRTASMAYRPRTLSSGAGAVPEIYAYGFRNPYRFSFDAASGDLLAADVGQNNIEELDRVINGGNYLASASEGT